MPPPLDAATALVGLAARGSRFRVALTPTRCATDGAPFSENGAGAAGAEAARALVLPAPRAPPSPACAGRAAPWPCALAAV
jgi:hypothetical protein